MLFFSTCFLYCVFACLYLCMYVCVCCLIHTYLYVYVCWYIYCIHVCLCCMCVCMLLDLYSYHMFVCANVWSMMFTILSVNNKQEQQRINLLSLSFQMRTVIEIRKIILFTLKSIHRFSTLQFIGDALLHLFFRYHWSFTAD